MLIVGLTGGIGSGKTTVSNLFADLGIDIIDTDVIAHDLVNHEPSILKQIVTLFGDDILQDDRTLDRKKLAKIIFNQKQGKQQLEGILHPKIRAAVQNRLQNCESRDTPPKYVIVVIPLLFETEFNDLLDRVLVVLADEPIRIQRIRQRDHRSLEQIQAIISSQVGDEKRISEADDIIENNHDPLVEMFTGIASLTVAYQFGITLQTLAALGFTWVLISLTLIDLKKQLLPDNMTLPLLWSGIFLSLFDVFTDLQSSIIGAMAGYLILWSVYHLFKG